MKTLKIITLLLILQVSVLGQTRGFDNSVEKLPPNFKGEHFQQLLREVIQRYLLDKEPSKGEFEKTEDFKKREQRFYDRPFSSGVNKGSLLAFVIPQKHLDINYNADNEIFNVNAKVYKPCKTSNQYWWICKSLIMNYKFDDSGDYFGSNMFGKKVLVDKQTEYVSGIELADWSSVEPNGNDLYSFTLSAPISAAPKIKPQLDLLVVGYLGKKPYEIYKNRSEPSINNPTDKIIYIENLVIDVRSIWFFNSVSGEIFSKIDSKEERTK